MPSELVVTGALNWDVNLFVKRLPRRGEEVVVERIERVPGGKGGNVSVAAARILGPDRVALMGCVGKDDVGRKQTSILREEGVNTAAVQVLDRIESGQAYISIEQNGSNIIETHFGANARLALEHIMSPAVQSILGGCSMMVVIDPPRRLAGKMLAEARRLRKTVLWHPGVLTRFGVKEFEKEMGDLDYLAVNEHEAARFAGKRGLENSLARLAKAAPRAKVIVTLGAKGVAFYERGKMSKIDSVSVDKLGKTVVNTTGSGDAFVGAFAAQKILGKNDSEALKYANMAGALKATKAETRGSPAKKELEEAYRKYFG
ncbi:hypothetical protein AUG19_01180 [archaeon 13_1_20CM_2_54_9]|nr:MAG: hypothetical protein AUJ07_05795 [Crenarchaeota archaeon 13_1_40CM_3_53_5]OLE77104.1 MAG: hypothetical protein AUG19_01180 [archaeon 13_1_20CM_2_54_9]